jgi:Uma2 family endonuclease
MVTLQLRQLVVHPGTAVQLQPVPWDEFENILLELGDRRTSRVAYYQETLEIRMPLPEVDKEFIGDMVKILLEELDIDNECFGSSTFKRRDMAAGIEPDNCFYIQNYRQMIGKRRLDLMVDPPPDLAIEVDVTSVTDVAAYQALGVPELWRFEAGRLGIWVLRDGRYVEVEASPLFVGLPMVDWVREFMALSQVQGRSQALKMFRQRIQGHNH